jgi:hypothetical protein
MSADEKSTNKYVVKWFVSAAIFLLSCRAMSEKRVRKYEFGCDVERLFGRQIPRCHAV